MVRTGDARSLAWLYFAVLPALLLGVAAPGCAASVAHSSVHTAAVGIAQDSCKSEPTVKQAGGFVAWYRWTLDNDYGQLCVYQAADAALGSAKPDTPRVVFMGDSITQIWEQDDPGFFSHGRVDRGISGQTTSQMLVRFRQDVIDLHPAVVQIMGGTNDIAGNTGATTLADIESNLASMVELAQAHGIKVILASVPPSNHFFWQPRVNPVAPIRELNAWIRIYAKTHGCTYVDDYDAMATRTGAMRPGLSYDGVHPTAKGFSIMESLSRKAIAVALATRTNDPSSEISAPIGK
ncbi:MAG TPA: GDSL-type esterase/lipase family protein [Rhodanobacteraceae bacterium]|nr:GDSL-type esterase/lipase family protein [Rhodanobacteraceae bacterium]